MSNLKISPNKHMKLVQISFIVPNETPADQKLAEILIPNPLEYNFVNMNVDATIAGGVHKVKIHTEYVTLGQTAKYYIEFLDNHPLIDSTNNSGTFNMPFTVNDINETVTIQDILNQFTNNKPYLTIDDVKLLDIPNFGGGGSNGSAAILPVNEYIVSELNVVNVKLDFYDDRAEFYIASTDGEKILQRFEVIKSNDKLSVNRIQNVNYNMLTFGFEFSGDIHGNVYLYRIGIFTNIPTVDMPQKFTLLTKRSTVDYIILPEGDIDHVHVTDFKKTYDYPNGDEFNYMFLPDYIAIYTTYVNINNNYGKNINLTNVDGAIDFNELVFCKHILGPFDDGLVTHTLVNAPPTVTKSTNFQLTNTIISNGTDVKMIQVVITNTEIYRRTRNTATIWTAWQTIINHKHKPSDILTDVNNRFVSDAEKTKWNNLVTNNTWLEPVNLHTDLANITNLRVGLAVYVINDKKIYIYNGTIWEPKYNIATSTTDGLLSKEMFLKIQNMSDVNDAYFKNNIQKGIFWTRFNTKAVETDYGTKTIDAVYRGSGDIGSSKVSSNSLGYGIGIDISATGVFGLSDYSLLYGIDSSINNSLRAINIGYRNAITSQNDALRIGNNLSGSTMIGIGKYNEGYNYFEIGAGDDTSPLNLMSIDVDGNMLLLGNLVTMADVSVNEFDLNPTPDTESNNPETTVFGTKGNYIDLNKIFNNSFEFTQGGFNLYKPFWIENPDFDIDDEGNPVGEEFMKELLGSYSGLMYDTTKAQLTTSVVRDGAQTTLSVAQNNKREIKLGATPNLKSYLTGQSVIEDNMVIVVVVNLVVATTGTTSNHELKIDLPTTDNSSYVIKLASDTIFEPGTHLIPKLKINFESASNVTTVFHSNPQFDDSPDLHGVFSSLLIQYRKGVAYCMYNNGLGADTL